MQSLKSLQDLNLDKVAQAIEADAGQAVLGLRVALAEANAGRFAQVHTPATIAAHKPGYIPKRD